MQHVPVVHQHMQWSNVHAHEHGHAQLPMGRRGDRLRVRTVSACPMKGSRELEGQPLDEI